MFMTVDEPRVEAWVASVLDGDPGRSVYLGPLRVVWGDRRRTVDLTAVALETAPRTLAISLRDVSGIYAEVVSLLDTLETDPLTGLLNRSSFQRRADAALARSEGSLLFFDLDGFKRINDQYGHTTGDAVLVEVAHRLVARLGPGALVCRMGGDEFVALLVGVPTAVAQTLARSVGSAIREPIDVGPSALEISASVGIAGYDQTTPLDTALAAADSAMYIAKREGKDQVVRFDDGLRTLAQRRESLIEENNALRAAAVRFSVEARTDAGTGLPNLRRLLEDLLLVHDRSSRSGTRYCLLFLDLDHFGTLNKKYGDAVGDRTLRSVATTLTDVMRDGEIVYRKGGEELVVILWDTDLEGGVAAAHRYRVALVEAALQHGGHPETPVVTASFGVAEGPGDVDGPEVLRIASLCMLSAKKYGRNRVSTEPLPVPDYPETA